MNANVLKLWKQMLKLAEIATDKAVLIVEDELAVGVEVYVQNEEGFAPAADGEYEAEDKVIVVAEGKVAEIREKQVEEQPKAEEPEAEEPAEEPVEQAEEPEPEAEPASEPDEKDARIAELEALLAEKDAKIAELEAEIAKQKEALEMSAAEPAKEAVKHVEKQGALKYFVH